MRTIFRGIAYLSYMTLQAIRGWILFAILKLRGQKAADVYGAKKYIAWARATLKIADVKVNVIGKERIPEGACVFVGNHQSNFDIPVLVASANRSIGFIAKKELLKVPVVGYWLQQVHSVTIDRENVREAINVINLGVENIKKGYSMGIFPEGTRAKDGKIKEFKKGSLKLATKANAPIVPVTIDGTYRAYEEEKKFKAAEVTITFGEPIYPEKLSREEQKELANIVHDIIASNLGQL